jgi:hypothetical protein
VPTCSGSNFRIVPKRLFRSPLAYKDRVKGATPARVLALRPEEAIS